MTDRTTPDGAVGWQGPAFAGRTGCPAGRGDVAKMSRVTTTIATRPRLARIAAIPSAVRLPGRVPDVSRGVR